MNCALNIEASGSAVIASVVHHFGTDGDKFFQSVTFAAIFKSFLNDRFIQASATFSTSTSRHVA
jgi:hypothetical protein